MHWIDVAVASFVTNNEVNPTGRPVLSERVTTSNQLSAQTILGDRESGRVNK